MYLQVILSWTNLGMAVLKLFCPWLNMSVYTKPSPQYTKGVLATNPWWSGLMLLCWSITWLPHWDRKNFLARLKTLRYMIFAKNDFFFFYFKKNYEVGLSFIHFFYFCIYLCLWRHFFLSLDKHYTWKFHKKGSSLSFEKLCSINNNE